MGDVGRVGSKLVGHSATEHAAASQPGSGMACATDGVMSRSRSLVRRNSVDGAPEHAEKVDYIALSSDVGGAAEHAAASQSVAIVRQHDAGARKGDASEFWKEAVVGVFCLLG